MTSWIIWSLSLLVFVLLLLWWRAATAVGRGNVARGRIARDAEDAAEALLARAGWRVLDRQLTARFVVEVDGEPWDASCRADLLVRRRGRTCVAEVKSSDLVADPTHPATRRQLLEYRLVFDVDGVLLVDPGRGTVREVRFPYA